MRLYLSSFKIGDHASDLKRLFGDGSRVAVIANAVDHKSVAERANKVRAEYAGLEALGFVVGEIDLRDYFKDDTGLEEALRTYDALWVRGGNTFLLRRAFGQSGLDKLLASLLDEDVIAYGGYSAGCCVLAPSLNGLEFVDDPNELADGYDRAIEWKGLNLLPYVIAPHFKSDHPESADVDTCVKYFEDQKIPHKPLRDGEVIIVQTGDE